MTKREYSVRKRKDDIKNILKIKKKVYLEDLFEEYNKPFVVVTFLSILEMVKEKEVAIKQNKNFDNILIELRN
ncbi:MAG: segregation/condensation protein A [Bacilli bacterium]